MTLGSKTKILVLRRLNGTLIGWKRQKNVFQVVLGGARGTPKLARIVPMGAVKTGRWVVKT